MSAKKLTIISILAALIFTFFIFDLGQYLSLEFFQQQRANIDAFNENNPFLTATVFFLLYVVITALSLPAAVIITLAGGAIFGVIKGTILVSFASTIGATLAFLIARTLLQDSVQKKFSSSLKSINKGIEKEGAFYLFGLRLVPVFPFFAVNLLMGLTKMPTWQYFLVSQIGMLPGTLVYVNAGTQIAQIESLKDIGSPSLIISFAILGIFPLLAKRILNMIQANRVYRPFNRPNSFDTNLVVIGAGSGGLVTSYIAAATKAKVTLIEKHKMGGDCLNTGCVPSKALIRSAKIAQYCRRADQFGLSVPCLDVEFEKVMDRVHEVISKIEPHDSIERYTSLGVDCVTGSAEIIDPYRVQVNDTVITTRNIVIATGARPRLPDIDGLNDIPFYTSDTIWTLRTKPKRLLVMGSGPIGCELAQAFRRLDIDVTIINRSDAIMPKEDSEVSNYVSEKFTAEGIQLKLGYRPKSFTQKGEHFALLAEKDQHEEELEFDCLLIAIGRQANTEGFGLDKLNIEYNPDGTILVNGYLQTTYPNIYACGDVTGPFQFTHAASHQAWYASVNALFGTLKKFKVDYSVIPRSTFIDPEVASVGLNEKTAQAEHISYEVTRYGIDDLDRAIADGENYGEVKVLTVPGKDKILGVTIIGHHAGELISEFVFAMKHGLGLNKILGTIHIYPTLSESNKFAAGEWKRNNVPERILNHLPKWHKWQRKE